MGTETAVDAAYEQLLTSLPKVGFSMDFFREKKLDREMSKCKSEIDWPFSRTHRSRPIGRTILGRANFPWGKNVPWLG